MKNNPHNDQGFTHTGCLTEQQMLDYNSNKLTVHERHQVERHTLDCEMCADALEGFALIKDHSKVDETVFAVNSMLAGEPVKSVKQGWWDARMKIAASVAILVLLGSVYYFQGRMKEQTDKAFADNFEAFPPAPREKGENPASDKQSNPAGGEDMRIATQVEDVPLKQEAKEGGKDKDDMLAFLQPETSGNEREYNEESSKLKSSTPNMDDSEYHSVPVPVEAMEDGNNGKARSEGANTLAATTKNDADKEEQKKPSLLLENISPTGANSNGSNTSGDGNRQHDEVVSTNTSGSNNSQSNSPSSPQKVARPNEGTISTSTFSTPSSTQGLVSTKDALNKPNDNTLVKRSKKVTGSTSTASKENAKLSQPIAKNKETPGPDLSAGSAEMKTEEVAILKDLKTAGDSVTFPAPFAAAMQKYQAGRYSEAVTLFEQALADEPANVEALFYSSVSYLAVNKPDKALANLDKVLLAKNHSLLEPAKWYKALAFIKKGDKKNARLLLEQIEKENGAYKQKAAEALKDLD
jgi:hypothetical protein